MVDQALRLYAEMVAQGKGAVVFLVGYPGSGCTATLAALAGGVSMPSSTPPTRLTTWATAQSLLGSLR